MTVENPIHELSHEHKYILKVVHGLHRREVDAKRHPLHA